MLTVFKGAQQGQYLFFGPYVPIRYECAFDGKVPSERCDYGVRLNTDQVKLPSGIKTYPGTSRDDFVDANRWVRKDAFLHLLKTLQK